MILINLRKVRKAKGLTQVKLADAVFLTPRTIINLEGGGSTTLNTAKRLAITLGVETSDLAII